MKKTFALLLVILCMCLNAGAVSELRFKHVGVKDGLSHSTVNAITQDGNGYLWVATADGLNRYDGERMRVYRDFAEGDSLSTANHIKNVGVTTGGDLWAVTEGALWHYDAEKDHFTPFRFPGKTFSEVLVTDGPIYVGTTDGILTFDPATKTFGSDRLMPLTSMHTMTMSGDLIYAGTGSGLFEINPSTGDQYHIPLQPGLLVVDVISRDGKVYIATEGGGLYIYDTRDKSMRHFASGDGSGLGSNYVRSLAFDDDGRLWTGTFNGLYILDSEEGHFRAYKPDNDPGSLSHSSVRAIFHDNQGGMWLGTFFGGLNYYNSLINRFGVLQHENGRNSLNDNVVSVIGEDSRANLWIGTNAGGINIYNPRTGEFRFITASDGLGSNDIKAFYFDDRAGKVYVGTHFGGLSVVDAASGRVETSQRSPHNVYGIVRGSEPGQLWVSLLDGIGVYDIASHTITPVEAKDVKGHSLKQITGLHVDPHGRLWAYGENSLVVFEPTPQGTLRAVDHVSGRPEFRGNVRVNQIITARNNDMYIAAQNGLWRVTPDSIMHFTMSSGLPGNAVFSVVEGRDGLMWMSTGHGVASYDPGKNEIRGFNSGYGLDSNQFMAGSGICSASGTIYFGGINGITYFSPSRLRNNPYSPTPQITGLRLFNRAVTPGDGTGLLDKDISSTDEIEFGADQSTFTIDFGVCNFVSGERNTFEYKLEGLDKGWNTADPGIHSVTYSNLPSGKYRFLLRALNNDGVESEGIASIGIRILPVWYKTWWAILLFVALAIGIIFTVITYYLHKKSLEAQIQAERVDRERKEELNEMKVRFFVNMSHELRTPLSLIMLPVDELIARGGDSGTIQKLNAIKNNTLRILHIVNQLLNYRRAELGVMHMKVRAVDVNALASNTADAYRTMARHKNIKFNIDSTLSEGTLFVDPEYLELILNNLLSNAFKYTPENQKVTLSLEEHDGRLIIKVSDSGCGIAPDKLDKIFVRFYQVFDNAGGSGIGLSLVKRLVDLHHGTISVESALGKGTEFTVSLPCRPQDYTEEELQAGRAAVEASVHAPSFQAPVELPADFFGDEDAPDEETEVEGEDKRPTIMVVDDNPEILKYVVDSLREKYRVLPVANGSKAIELLSSENIDLILTDIMMPDIDGMQLCRTVKRNLRTSHIPIIILSAKTGLDDQLDAMKVGADDYLPKPFSMPLLLGKINNLLHTRERLISHYSNTTLIEPDKAALNPLDEEFLRKAVKIMDDHLDDSQFSTDAFASLMCMSRSNLHLKMKALTGESTNEFIRRVRLNKAVELLKTGRYTIAEVSAMVGYSTPSYFATMFKKFYGESPSDYLKNK